MGSGISTNRTFDAVSSGERGWELALATIEFAMQAIGLVVIGQNWMGDLGQANYVELTIALLSFFIMNLETSYDLNGEKAEAVLYPWAMFVFYWLTLVLMIGSTLVGGVLSVLSMLQLANVNPNDLRYVALLAFGIPTLCHLLYRLALVVVVQVQFACVTRSRARLTRSETESALEGPSSSDLWR